MRSTVSVVTAALALLLAPMTGALAQGDATPPKHPIPYAKLVAHPAKPKPKAADPAAAPAAKTDKPDSVPTSPPAVQPPADISAPAGAQPAAPLPSTTAPAAPPPAPRPAARLAPGQAVPAAELEAFVDGVLRDAMAREHIAGATVSVVQNGQVALKKGYGFASLSPRRAVDPDQTLFRIGSISKTFTWIALMKEVEAGRMRLNQPINLYLPEKVQIRDQGYDQPVRVANLMDHSAGFEDRALGQLFERNFDRVRPIELYLRQERPKRVHPPGAVSSYSNYGAAIAGEAVSYVAGKPYERLVEDEILNPLGMGHTTFREPHPPKAGLPPPMPPALASDVSDGFHWTPLGFERRDYEFIEQIAPAGAGSSTAGDMARYMLMQLGGGQLGGTAIYGSTTVQAFQTPLRKTPTGVNGWAHGFMVFDLPGGYRGFGHGGATLSFFSNMVVIPELNLGIFISTNTSTGRPLVNRLPELVVQHFYAAPDPFPRAGSAELARRAGEFAGYYMTTRRTYSGLEGFVDRLRGGVAVSVTHDGRLITEDNGSVKPWTPEGPVDDGRFIATQGAERIAFDLAGGQARAYHVGNGTMALERTGLWAQPRTLATLAMIAGIAALATLAGVVARNRREFRENQIQTRASLVQNIQAVLWLLALGLFALWMSKTGDDAEIMYRWPGILVITASACALVAAALTVLTLLALPAVWRGGRRVDSWTPLRKAAFTITTLIYIAFSFDLGLWGALSLWSA